MVFLLSALDLDLSQQDPSELQAFNAGESLLYCRCTTSDIESNTEKIDGNHYCIQVCESLLPASSH